MKDTLEGADARQYTGTVGLFVFGKRPEPKTGAQILEIGKASKYYEAGRLQRRLGRASNIEYIPRELVPNAIEEALMQGLLAYKFNITGSSRISQAILGLDRGTYYFWLDFVEGHFQGKTEGKWIGRIVSTSGSVACLVAGVEAKQVVYFHPDPRDHDGAPHVSIHGFGADLDLASDESEWWTDVDLSWIPFGGGCFHQTLCVPKNR